MQKTFVAICSAVMFVSGGASGASLRSVAAEPRSGCAGSFVQVKTDSPGFYNNVLSGVVATGGGRAWAVGQYRPKKKGPETTLIERYAGSRFHLQSGPSPKNAELLGVDAIGSGAAMAVGDAKLRPLVERWDGSAWTIDPSVPKTAGRLFAIDIRSSSDAWAVGYRISQGENLAYSLRWDGQTWTSVPTQDTTSNNDQLASVSADAADDAWAVGASFDPNGNASTLIEHWDGSSWTIVPSPDPGSTDNTFSAVLAVWTDDAWIVGNQQSGEKYGPIVLHWDGAAWTAVSDAMTGQGGLVGLAGLGSDDVWASGGMLVGRAQAPFVEHWDGTEWTAVPAEQAMKYTSASSITEGSPKRLWIVGQAYDDPDQGFFTFGEEFRCAP